MGVALPCQPYIEEWNLHLMSFERLLATDEKFKFNQF